MAGRRLGLAISGEIIPSVLQNETQVYLATEHGGREAAAGHCLKLNTRLTTDDSDQHR